ncbi:MAG: haloacid dehalogenase type II [Actinomycetota bacterium]|nr:haloacid dehalogenase type II [Actinomycetota bacterium]
MRDQRLTPAVAVFDVNETLSDLDGLATRLQDAGADPGVLPVWFAATLRDGFAITAAGGYADFAEIAVPTLTALLSGGDGLRDSAQTVAERVVGSMAELDLHPDVADGLRTFHAAGVRIVTLSNGSSRVAESLLERAGVRDLVEQCLSVSDAGRWKPAPEAYAYAADRCEVEAGELALIAVHPWDIDGAARAGLRTGWLSRDGAPYPPYLRAPEATGPNLPKLAAILTARS